MMSRGMAVKAPPPIMMSASGAYCLANCTLFFMYPYAVVMPPVAITSQASALMASISSSSVGRQPFASNT